MRTWGLGVLVCLSLAVFAAAAGEKTVVPGTLLTLGMEVKIECKGDTLKELDEDSQAVLKKADEFSFKTDEGIYGSVMAYQPKDEYSEVISEWCEAMATGLADAVKTEGKLVRRETAQFGKRRGFFFAMESEGCLTEFALIGGKDEIVLIAVSAEQKKGTELSKVMAGLSYGGEAATQRKPFVEDN